MFIKIPLNSLLTMEENEPTIMGDMCKSKSDNIKLELMCII